MLNLDDYPKEKDTVLSRIPRKYGHILHYIGKSNQCEDAGEPWKYMAWRREYEKGEPLPKEMRGRIPPDANMLDAFLWSLYSQETMDRILKNAKKDPHIRMAMELRSQELALEYERFPQD